MKVEIMNVAEVNAETQEQLLQFAKFNKEQAGVYGVLCPTKSTLTAEQIAADVDIPERVKEIVEMTKDRFYKFEVWESDLYEVKDPILIGREKSKEKDQQYDWYDKHFLLARWGEELDSFSNLKKKAIEVLTKKTKIALIRSKASIDSYLTDVQLFVENGISKGDISIPSFNPGCLE